MRGLGNWQELAVERIAASPKDSHNKKSASPEVRCQLQDVSDTEATLLIYDEIGENWWGGGVSSRQVIEDIAELDVETLHVRINSGGGSATEGVAIFNAIGRLKDTKVVTYVDALAASAASIIMLAGDEIVVERAALIMIHDPWGIEIGTADDMRKMAEILDKHADQLAGLYAARTGDSREDMRALMAEETWLDGPEAVEMGMADRFVGDDDDDDANAAGTHSPVGEMSMEDVLVLAAQSEHAIFKAAGLMAS